MGICRRKHPRFEIRSPITVSVLSMAALAGWTIDVSYGGIGLHLPDVVAPGDRLQFRLELGGRRELIEARVRHVTPDVSGYARVGLQWTNTGVRERELLCRFVASCEQATQLAA